MLSPNHVIGIGKNTSELPKVFLFCEPHHKGSLTSSSQS